ncbi:hypothetical protein DENSPDRAFT_594408 [Dentipellis sp. KUC8613]|nr:hypothetical protein DENSPDRAFT_594408 [Dentipellis sp. KUC8613]
MHYLAFVVVVPRSSLVYFCRPFDWVLYSIEGRSFGTFAPASVRLRWLYGAGAAILSGGAELAHGCTLAVVGAEPKIQ